MRPEIVVILVVMGAALLLDWACLTVSARAEKRDEEMRRRWKEKNKRDKD